MTLLGTARFFSSSLAPQAGNNAAPTGDAITLNFDLRINTAPVGASQTLTFEVTASN